MTSLNNIEMYEKLQSVYLAVESAQDRIDDKKSCALYYNEQFLEKYGVYRKPAKFLACTLLSKDHYKELVGQKKSRRVSENYVVSESEDEIKDITTKKSPQILLQVVFGLGASYVDAVVFFEFNGISVLAFRPEEEKLNLILKELNKLEGRKIDPRCRLHHLKAVMIEQGFPMSDKFDVELEEVD